MMTSYEKTCGDCWEKNIAKTVERRIKEEGVVDENGAN